MRTAAPNGVVMSVRWPGNSWAVRSMVTAASLAMLTDRASERQPGSSNATRRVPGWTSRLSPGAPACRSSIRMRPPGMAAPLAAWTRTTSLARGAGAGADSGARLARRIGPPITTAAATTARRRHGTPGFGAACGWDGGAGGGAGLPPGLGGETGGAVPPGTGAVPMSGGTGLSAGAAAAACCAAPQNGQNATLLPSVRVQALHPRDAGSWNREAMPAGAIIRRPAGRPGCPRRPAGPPGAAAPAGAARRAPWSKRRRRPA